MDKNIKSEDAHLVDVAAFFRNNENKWLRRMPGFVIRKIKKIFHEDRVNEVITTCKDDYGVDFVKGNLKYLNVTVETYGLDNVPDEGRFIYACNHCLGGLDFYAAIVSAHKKHPKIKVIANEILSGFYNLHTVFLPVNVFSKNPPEKIQAIKDVLATEDTQLMTFPAGFVARKTKGVLDDGVWHPSFIMNAITYKRDIIPVFIDAENSKHFYRLANFRKKIGIKFAIELFWLMDELFRKENSTIPVIFGKPISYKTFTDEKTHPEWAAYVKEKVYNLKNNDIV